MTTILWLSRHIPSDLHRNYLERVFGSLHIIHQPLGYEPDPKDFLAEVEPIIQEFGVDEIVCSVSVQHLAEFTRNGYQPLRAVSRKILTERRDGNGELEYDYEFVHFERVKMLTYESEIVS